MKRLVLPVYLALCCVALPMQSWVSADELRGNNEPRRLVLVLDGVPYETIRELRAEGYFKSFKEPARMVSTFPSLTNPAMIEILGAHDSPGYEDHYYDRETNKLVGGVHERFRGGKFIHGTFREKFDYHAPAFRGSLAYIGQPLGAILVAQADVSAFRRAFKKSKSRFFVGYVGATDSLAHLGGEGPLKSLLRSLDRSLEEMRREAGGALEIELVSDHGNNYMFHHTVKLGSALEKAGFKIEKSIENDKSVILPRYGLVGAGILFTRPENRQRVAEASLNAKGVDFAVFPVPGEENRTIELVSKRGKARLYRSGDSYRYEALEGDPLELQPIIGELAVDENGFAACEAWWAATKTHKYTDPMRRIFDGFNAHVVSRGDVIVSFENGYLIGSPFFGSFSLMFATHGNLLQRESYGFAMSTRQEMGEAVRGSDVNKLYELKEFGNEAVSMYLSREGHCEGGRLMAMKFVTTED